MRRNRIAEGLVEPQEFLLPTRHFLATQRQQRRNRDPLAIETNLDRAGSLAAAQIRSIAHDHPILAFGSVAECAYVSRCSDPQERPRLGYVDAAAAPVA